MDIGGANTKAALLNYENNRLIDSNSYIEYFPFWEQSMTNISEMFERIITNFILKLGHSIKEINYIAITITAELSDAFQTKREGIITILDALAKIYPKNCMKFINHDAFFYSFEEAKRDVNKISAANWVSTSLFLGNHAKNCILIDAGSTTIDIIPILRGKPVAKGYNDITRLLNHELIYTGGLRATIPSITHFVPYHQKMVRISFEKFALVSDVHRILNHISEKEYLNDTADNRSKSLEDCYARLSRIICMDIESLSKEELDEIARYIHEKQLELIEKEFSLFYTALIKRYADFKQEPLFIITGLAADFLIKQVLKKLGFQNIKDFKHVTNIPDNISSSAFAVAGALYQNFNSNK